MDQSTTSILRWPWPLSAFGRRKAPARRSHPLWIIDYMEGTVWCEPPG